MNAIGTLYSSTSPSTSRATLPPHDPADLLPLARAGVNAGHANSPEAIGDFALDR